MLVWRAVAHAWRLHLSRLRQFLSGGDEAMDRKDIVLAGMAPAKGGQHSPVQMQKLFFLLDNNITPLVAGPHFNFSPYHYGPFDKAVYDTLEELEIEGLVDTVPDRRWMNYRLTLAGQAAGERLFGELPEPAQRYIERVSELVRSLTFTQLVSAIYRAYPEMRANSVFQG